MGGRGSSSGINRGGSVSVQYSGTVNVNNERFNADASDAISKLEEMAKRGEMPSYITGSPEKQQAIYEAIDRLYAKPQGEFGNYEIKMDSPVSKRGNIEWEYNLFKGIEAPVRFSSKDSEAARSGKIKHTMFRQRGQLEEGAMTRMNGFVTVDMALKWGSGKRLYSDSEKVQINRELEGHVQRLFKSPLSSEGRERNEFWWERTSGGWWRRL